MLFFLTPNKNTVQHSKYTLFKNISVEKLNPIRMKKPKKKCSTKVEKECEKKT